MKSSTFHGIIFGGCIGILVFTGFYCVDYMLSSKTDIMSVRITGHHYRHSWVELRPMFVGKSVHYQSVYHPESYELLFDNGVIEVTKETYESAKDGSNIKVSRIVGLFDHGYTYEK